MGNFLLENRKMKCSFGLFYRLTEIDEYSRKMCGFCVEMQESADFCIVLRGF